jgi:hypothetical protein
MLRGLDYFLLPAFLKDLLQPGGYDTMLLERDAWFHSAMCLIRDGVNCLEALKEQQEMGLNLLNALEQEGGNNYDDYIPTETQFTDTKPNLGLSRRQVGSDQAMRAGHLFNPNTPAAGMSLIHARGSISDTKPTFTDKARPELSDTDNEEHQQKRRRSANGRGRRRHLLSPTSARSRVLSSQARHSSKRIKTEELTCTLFKETPVRSPRGNRQSRLDVGESSTKIEMEESEPLPLKLKPRFRVDSRHLAALMAVGTSPPSSPS